jgi:hypothetical protein
LPSQSAHWAEPATLPVLQAGSTCALVIVPMGAAWPGAAINQHCNQGREQDPAHRPIVDLRLIITQEPGPLGVYPPD